MTKEEKKTPLFEFLIDRDIDKINNIIRWNDINTINKESVGHHTFIVSLVTQFMLSEFCNEEAYEFKYKTLSYANHHDLDEIVSGDVLHPLKYNKFNGEEIRSLIDGYVESEFKRRYSKLAKESSGFDEILNNVLKIDLNQFSKAIVKCADLLSMFFYVKKEMSLGNSSIKKEFEYVKTSLLSKLSSLIFILSEYRSLNRILHDEVFKVNIIDNLTKFHREFKTLL